MSADWFKMWCQDRKHVPGSQRQGIAMAVSQLAPLRAFIALISGDPAGNLSALQCYVNHSVPMCKVCGMILVEGRTHTTVCSLAAQANMVLTDDTKFQIDALSEEEEKLKLRIESIGVQKRVLAEEAEYEKTLENCVQYSPLQVTSKTTGDERKEQELQKYQRQVAKAQSVEQSQNLEQSE